ncbi:MAG: prepilin-type N-terminal cleavage/methylation domain-containing protein [Thermoguttaceae bacterium]
MRITPHTADRAAVRRGFTLTELMVVTTLIGVMAAMSVPSFQRAVTQSRTDIAAANLRAIWAAERLYWLENHSYAGTLSQQSPPGLIQLGLLDPSLPLTQAGVTYQTGGYYFSVVLGTDSTSAFTATATNALAGPPTAITIDQNGTVTTYPPNTPLTFQ